MKILLESVEDFRQAIDRDSSPCVKELARGKEEFYFENYGFLFAVTVDGVDYVDYDALHDYIRYEL